MPPELKPEMTPQASEPLMPCPFCGSSPKLITKGNSKGRVRCNGKTPEGVFCRIDKLTWPKETWNKQFGVKAKQDLWDMVIIQDTPELKAAFTANYLRGTIKIPDEIKLRIQFPEDTRPEAASAVVGDWEALKQRALDAAADAHGGYMNATKTRAVKAALETIRTALAQRGEVAEIKPLKWNDGNNGDWADASTVVGFYSISRSVSVFQVWHGGSIIYSGSEGYPKTMEAAKQFAEDHYRAWLRPALSVRGGK